MSKPTLYLHIGVAKTGTTYIQTLLKNQRKALLKTGILYPLCGIHGTGHSAIAINYIGQPFKDSMRRSNIFNKTERPLMARDNILYEVSSARRPIKFVIISAEGLALADKPGIESVAAQYSPYFDIKVVVFLRRQDHLAESFRSQAYRVKQSGYDPKGPFDPINANFNHYALVEKWSDQFGKSNINIIEYPESRGDGKLASLAKEALSLPRNLKADDQHLNQRLSRDVLEYIYFYSSLTYAQDNYFKSLVQLQRYVEKHVPDSSGYHLFYSPQERQEIIKVHQESNDLLSNKYLKGQIFDGLAPIDLNESWAAYPGLSKTLKKIFDELLNNDQ
jgi:hypothetical protein